MVVIAIQDPITTLILHIPTIIPRLFHHSTHHHPHRHQIMVMRVIGLMLTCVLPIPHLLLIPSIALLNHLQWGGHPLPLLPKARILTPVRKVFIMIVQPTSTTKLLSPILNWVTHHLSCILKLVTKVAGCQAILLRLLMSKRMRPLALRHRHQCTRWII